MIWEPGLGFLFPAHCVTQGQLSSLILTCAMDADPVYLKVLSLESQEQMREHARS